MGILGNAVPGAGGGAYTIDNSLRFRNSASAYLSRTPSVAGNRKIFTWSSWIKRGNLPSLTSYDIFSAAESGSSNPRTDWQFDGNYRLNIAFNPSGSSWSELITTQVFRDSSAWYHIVIAVDTTQATASNRVKLYVNGSQVTAFDSAGYPSQNVDLPINNTWAHSIGRYQATAVQYFDGYMANINFIDGQQLTPSSFGETNASTGVWQPKAYTGTYGTNGFYLKFSDIATTSGSNAGLGKDFSGNGNYWNTNNISVTSGVTYDAMTDSPTPKSATVGNFCTMNPVNTLQTDTLCVFSNANLLVSDAGSASQNAGANGTIGVSSGKFYWEVTLGTNYSNGNNYTGIGISTSYMTGCSQTGIIYKAYNGRVEGSMTLLTTVATATQNDVIGVALDATAQTVAIYKNNSLLWSGSYSSYIPSGQTFVYPSFFTANQASGQGYFNFGQRPFTYTPPTGFKRLNTYNLPTPTIGASSTTLANKYFDATLYTGTGLAQSITNAGSFQPDFVWIKNRSRGSDHLQVDAVRGVTSGLKSNGTIAQRTDTFFTSFNSNGFSLPINTLVDYWYTNINGDSEVAWQWRASNTTAVTNTSGSITSSVSANTTAGFSIVTYSGNASVATVGHGLGATPKMIIVKQRNAAGNYFVVWFSGATNANQSLWLGATNSVLSTPNYWGGSTPTSSVFSVGNDSATNGSGSTYVAYCWSEIASFSKLGTFTGNGSSDGPFIYCGFRPRFLLIRRSTNIANWVIWDAARAPYNQVKAQLFPNTSDAEDSTGECDFLSNGFKIRGTNVTWNGSGDTIIYAAFAESPFNYSLAR